MSTIDHSADNVLLLRVGCITLLIALVLAWCLVLSGMEIQFVLDIFKSKKALLSSHLDFLMMTMLLVAIYATRIPLPMYVQWPTAIGSVTNPTCFLLESIFPEYDAPLMLEFVYASIVIATVGYGLAAIKLFRATMK